VASFAASKHLGASYSKNVSIASTVIGNIFDLGIAVAMGVFQLYSGQALAGVISSFSYC